MATTTSTTRVIYIRVSGDLKKLIKADADAQRRTEAEVIRHILRNHYNGEPSNV